MRVKEMRELSAEEIKAKIADTHKEIVQLRFELATRKLQNTAGIANARKRLARLLTIEKERELGLKR
ncbi:MAG: 50S ribosomal protein L29 [Candidatus Obscuribacterales bacterium]|nr:50S ribosomal protein L29 [Candidatus Obscuribacterales bacterium]